jgi:hypothetical protein
MDPAGCGRKFVVRAQLLIQATRDCVTYSMEHGETAPAEDTETGVAPKIPWR